MLLKKVLSEYYDGDLDGVIKIKQVFCLGLLVYEKQSLTQDNTIINKFIVDKKRNKIGFNVEVEDKDKEVEDSQTSTDNQEGRMD